MSALAGGVEKRSGPEVMPGTPTGRPRRAGRPPLTSREDIVRSTLALVDAEGLDAVSMRRLAEVLGLSAASLYNHVRTKEEILDAVAHSIVERVDASAFESDGWRAGLERWMRSYYEALAAHPNVVPWFARGPRRGAPSLQKANLVYGGLLAAGWPPAWATRVGAAARQVVFGAALGSFAAGFPDDPDLYAVHYPHLKEAHRLRGHREQVDRGSFELGLRCLLAGLDEVHREVAVGEAGR